MLDNFHITNQFWDEVFPMRAWAFQRSLEFQNKYRYDNEIVAKMMLVYTRMDEILRIETKKQINGLVL